MSVNLVKMQDRVEHTELAIRLIPECRPYLYSDAEPTADSHRKFLASLPKDDDLWVIEKGGVLVGIVSVYHKSFDHSRCEWGRFMLDAKYHGTGSIVEFMILDYVFRTLKMHKLFCEVFEENSAVVGLHEKFGFTIEGKFRDHIKKTGIFKNVIYLGILADEWEQKRVRFETLFQGKAGSVE